MIPEIAASLKCAALSCGLSLQPCFPCPRPAACLAKAHNRKSLRNRSFSSTLLASGERFKSHPYEAINLLLVFRDAPP